MIKKVDPVEIITDESIIGTRSSELDIRKENKEMRDIVAKLKATIIENNLPALSAPEIGEMRRIFTINFNGDYRTFINPIITNVKGFQLSKETCASVKGTYIRPRNNDIFVTYQTPLGKIESKELIGAAAILFQHQLDHLEGLLLPDIGFEIDEEFENASEEEQQEVINFYLDTLEIRQSDLDKEIAEDPELKQISDAIDFMAKVQSGEVKLGDSVTVEKPKENEDGEHSNPN